MNQKITMLHGSGGRATGELINKIFAEAFWKHSSERGNVSESADASLSGGQRSEEVVTGVLEDAAVVAGPSAGGRLAVTTDSFVVTPLFYPGGDIGRLAVCGTVNDLLMRGAVPRYLTCGFILEEGASTEELSRIAASMARTAEEARVAIVAGDTKVIEGHGGIYINTTGVGFVPEGVEIGAAGAKAGDTILVSGPLGDHHATILSQRLSVENGLKSDNAPLVEIVEALRPFSVHTLRDVTRGGLATVLCELAEASGQGFVIEEKALPVSEEVRSFCGILGLDPLYMGNEGKLVCILPQEEKDEALAAIRRSRYGEGAVVIGEVTEDHPGRVRMRTSIGGLRELTVLEDEGLPRIC